MLRNKHFCGIIIFLTLYLVFITGIKQLTASLKICKVNLYG